MASVLAFLIAILFLITPAIAEPPNVITIVKQMKEVFEPSRPSTRKVVVSSTSEHETFQFVAGLARKTFPDGKRILMVMLEPESVRGNTYLFWE